MPLSPEEKSSFYQTALSSSRAGLQDAFLSRLNRIANLEREIREARAELADWREQLAFVKRLLDAGYPTIRGFAEEVPRGAGVPAMQKRVRRKRAA